jgi:hypothetical protein
MKLYCFKRCHEGVWGSEVIASPFLTSALAVSEWSASRLGRFTFGEIATGTHWIWDWVSPRAGLHEVKRKFLTPPGLELRPLSQHVASRYTDWAIPAPVIILQWILIILLVITPWNLIDRWWCFGGNFSLHLQGKRQHFNHVCVYVCEGVGLITRQLRHSFCLHQTPK